MSLSLVRFSDVSKIFPPRRGAGSSGVVAVDEVTFELHAGEIVAVVGQSGAGKSTIGRLLLGLEQPTSGDIVVDGESLPSLRGSQLRRLRRRMHLIAQDPYQSLHPGMNVGQIVEEPLAISGAASGHRREQVADALTSVGLTPAHEVRARYPHELSGGQRQRVALARAFVAEPSVVVADEPTSMLDASLCAGILELILAMRRELGTTFLYITHTLAVARYVADRIVVVHRGRVVEVGPTEDIIGGPRHPYTRLLLAAAEGDVAGMKQHAGELDAAGAAIPRP